MTREAGAQTDTARTWHLSRWLVASGDGGAPAPTGQGATAITSATPVLHPASRRSVSWWVAAVPAKIAQLRRGAARRMLRWIRLHPELRVAADNGTLVRLVIRTFRDRGRRSASSAVRHRPTVVIAAGVEGAATLGRPAPVLDDVSIEPAPRALERSVRVAPAPNSAAGADVLAVDGPDGTVEMLAPVDVHRWNPSGFQWHPTRTTTLALADVVLAEPSPKTRLLVAHGAAGISCDPDPRLTGGRRIRAIAELACAGVPLTGPLTDDEQAELGGDLAALIARTDPAILRDARSRELHAVRIRRAAHARWSPAGWWGAAGPAVGVAVTAVPTVSVLLPSNRPSDVVGAARAAARQCGVDTELVVGLHGDHMPSELERRLADAVEGHLVVRRFPDDVSLGRVLNGLTEAAGGELVSKWDDDDWYDAHHLGDLVQALTYSGAALVGKAAEFVHLERLDVTIRRFATGSERWSTTIAGGTLLLRTDELASIGWSDVPRQVDRRLIEQLELNGRSIYRTHGFGYVLRRRAGGQAAHTWAIGDDYFLGQATDQRRGLALDFAGFGDS